MKKRNIVLVFLSSLGMITFLDRISIAVAGPEIQADLGLSPEQWGWVLGVFVLSYGLFQVPIGSLGDRFGARAVLAGIVIWWSIFTGLTAVATGFAMLLIFRFLFGIGEAGAYPVMSSSAARWFPSGERGRVQGFIWGSSRLGGALSPLLIVPVQQVFGWRVAFVGLGVLGLVWGLVWWFWYRNHPSEKEGVTHAELAEIGASSRPAPQEKAPWAILLRNRQFWLILAMYWFYVWGSWFYFSWLHTYLVTGRGFTVQEMGLYAAFPFILGTISNVVGGYLSDSLSKKYGLLIGRRLIGAASLAVSAVLLAAAGLASSKVLIILFLSLSFGVMDLMLPSAWAICLDVGHKYAGAVTGAMNTAGNIGGFMCTVLFGYLVTAFDSYNVPVFVISGMLLVSAFLFSRIDPRKPLVDESESVSISAR